MLLLTRLLYILPYIGIITGIYFVFTLNLIAAYLLAGFALIQSIICLGYLILMIIYNGKHGTLEIEVELGDAIIPIIFLTLSTSSFLYLVINNLTGL